VETLGEIDAVVPEQSEGLCVLDTLCSRLVVPVKAAGPTYNC
jgi:hypothetical protein